MGGCVGVNNPESETTSFFVDARLLAGEKLMKHNKLARVEFVEYIKAGTWAESLSNFEDYINVKSSCDGSVWSKFGYKSPHRSPQSIRTSSSSGKLSSELYIAEPDSIMGTIHHKLMLEECYNAISNSHLFKTDELPAVLFAALLPIYLCSAEYLESKDNHDWATDLNVSDTCVPEYIPEVRSPVRRRSERLHDWLLGAAAVYDSSQLEQYLADPTRNWVEDFKQALFNLPLTIYLSTVDAKKMESKVVYCNTVKKSMIFGDRSCIGTNLHEMFSERSPAHIAEQIETAVFGAKKYKRCALGEYDSCVLRALKPVKNTHGEHVYTLGVESYPFVDPQQEESVVKEQPFQQVEDLLALLPLLIRLPSEVME